MLKAPAGADDDHQRQIATFVVNLCGGRVPNGSWVVDKVASPGSAAPASSDGIAEPASGGSNRSTDPLTHGNEQPAGDPADHEAAKSQAAPQQQPAAEPSFAPEPPSPGTEAHAPPVATPTVSTATFHHLTVPPPVPAPAATASAMPAHSGTPAASVGMPFQLTAATMQHQQAGGAGSFSDSATMAADMLHSILVQAAKAKGEDTSTYVQKAIQSPAIMQVWVALSTLDQTRRHQPACGAAPHPSQKLPPSSSPTAVARCGAVVLLLV